MLEYTTHTHTHSGKKPIHTTIWRFDWSGNDLQEEENLYNAYEDVFSWARNLYEER